MAMPRRIAVIDVSHWHSTYDAAYCRILRDLGREIVGVSDTNPAIAADRANRFGSVAFTDYRTMIERTRPEFVIALGRHCDMPDTFRFLIEAGVPFVMEKPWGTDAETVDSLVRLAEDRGAWVSVPFVNRYGFWATTVRRLLQEGEFGAVSHIVYRVIRPTMRRYVEWDSPWMTSKAQAGGGALLNLGGHGFDMARFLTGQEPTVVAASISYRVHAAEVEDYGLVTMRLPDGTLFHNEVGYTMPTWPENRTDGEQKIAGERLLVRQVPEGVHLIGPGRDEVILQPADWGAGYPKAIKDALEAYGRGDAPPIPPGACAGAMRLIAESYRVAATA